jgi:hypothetical protein
MRFGEIERLQVAGLITPGYWPDAHPARTALNRSRILFPQNALPTRASGSIVTNFKYQHFLHDCSTIKLHYCK